jgi:predicted CXXCH cytochrome family protein
MIKTPLLLLASVLAAPLPAGAAPNRKLRPGAGGKVCLDCHADFVEKLKRPFVHTPVKQQDCVGCHNPHASDHGKLLAAQPGAICGTCHDVVPEKPRSAHEPVARNRCVDCHDPHAAAAKGNLVRPAAELCAGCHKPVAERAASAKYRHRPVEQGCVACHDPHGSAKAPSLLKAEVPGLCLRCHDVSKPVLARKHMGYAVAKASCTSCHEPHGSAARGMLHDNVHPPVAKGMCTMCHEAPGKGGFKTRQVGAALCKGCHSQKMLLMGEKARVHQPVAEGACLACHSPHASGHKGLLRAAMAPTCGACHADTAKRQERSPTKHDPVRDGKCTACHDPHSGEVPLLLVQANGIDLCGRCHDWQKHSSHPIGESRKDPRSRNLSLECLTCHRAHGTEHKHFLSFGKTTDLCTKCHEQFRR